MFKNREDAANLLVQKLIDFRYKKDLIIVAIPRGAVPIGAIIAEKLNAPLEIVLSKKIGHPFNKEFAIGSATLNGISLTDGIIGVSNQYIEEETTRIRALLTERYQWYYGDKKPLNFNNKTIILVDDGVATGSTLLSSVELIHQQKPSKIIVAIPVSSKSAYSKMKKSPYINAIICLSTPENFNAVGQFYDEFKQINDAEVIELMKRANQATNFNH